MTKYNFEFADDIGSYIKWAARDAKASYSHNENEDIIFVECNGFKAVESFHKALKASGNYEDMDTFEFLEITSPTTE